MKRCSCCGETKDYSSFFNHKGTRDRLQTQCKSCQANNQRKRLYGITNQEFQALVEDQDFECAICCEELDIAGGNHAVDHNHTTGKVRGILCRSCNHGIGKLKDSPAILLKATEYLNNRGFYGPETI